MMNRAERMKLLAAAEALAEAVKKSLKDEPARLYDTEGVAVSERVPGVGLLSTSLSLDGATITDTDRFTEWVAARYPTEVETVTVTRIRNPEWAKKILGSLKPIDPEEVLEGEATSCEDDEGTVVPGAAWFRGGKFLYASVKIDSALKRRCAEEAAAFVERGVPIPAISAAQDRVIEGAVTESDLD